MAPPHLQLRNNLRPRAVYASVREKLNNLLTSPPPSPFTPGDPSHPPTTTTELRREIDYMHLMLCPELERMQRKIRKAPEGCFRSNGQRWGIEDDLGILQNDVTIAHVELREIEVGSEWAEMSLEEVLQLVERIWRQTKVFRTFVDELEKAAEGGERA